MKSQVFAGWFGSFAVAFVLFAGVPAAAQTIYPTSPDWTSLDTDYATGAALADMNRDGWLDLVVSNGNDIVREKVAVYTNDGSGGYPTLPSWQSNTIAYYGHLSVADVNGDGWPDVAVAILLNQGGTCAHLYLNNAGTLASTPSWSSAFNAPAFSCAFGDANNDGRPDLAVGTGDAYSATPHAYKNVVHMNIGGSLEATPSWQSADTWCYDAIHWTDANSDGWMDLLGVGSKTRNWLYVNNAGALNTAATWQTTDVTSQFGLMAVSGDVNNDGYREIVIADNNQLTGGSGRFRRYNGLSGGFFSQTANWTYLDGYCSAVALADVDADGDLDLATGAWWDRTRLFYNNAGSFGAASNWTSAGTSVVEKIVFGDIDRRSEIQRSQSFPPSSLRLYQLRHQPIERITRVTRDGVDLTAAQFTYDREFGWISVQAAPTASLVIDYVVSTSLDMAVVNWDETVGNFAYYNRLFPRGDLNCDGTVNPFDITPFLTALSDPTAYETAYPDCSVAYADMNLDGTVNPFDIQHFVDALTPP